MTARARLWGEDLRRAARDKKRIEKDRKRARKKRISKARRAGEAVRDWW
jgi:hypothetical protein